ncbi:MAG: enoyl-CoA hydratase-related protein [Chloroflexi bacterium]|nr:enoyl-CoA hydratase-related protein [Chloroflexota bacterium]
MDFEHILYEKRDRIAYVTLNRPSQLNALHPDGNREVREAFTDFRDDDDVLVAILSGAGDRAFCAGNDLKYMAEHGKPGEPYPDAHLYPFGGITANFKCWKPIIAAVHGYALGGGFELALSCDLIIATEDARFGLPEATVGVVASGGGPHRIVRQMPLNIAMGILLGGKPITAEEAHRWGLVNEIASTKGDLIPTAERWANDIMEAAPLSVRATKQVALQGLESTLDVAINREYSEFRRARHSEDFVEGPRAFAAKRKPIWKGK